MLLFSLLHKVIAKCCCNAGLQRMRWAETWRAQGASWERSS